MPNTYTHGHHESVLRSHRWRTAENSAGYLLPHLAPGMSVLTKPFPVETMAARIRSLIEATHEEERARTIIS